MRIKTAIALAAKHDPNPLVTHGWEDVADILAWNWALGMREDSIKDRTYDIRNGFMPRLVSVWDLARWLRDQDMTNEESFIEFAEEFYS